MAKGKKKLKKEKVYLEYICPYCGNNLTKNIFWAVCKECKRKLYIDAKTLKEIIESHIRFIFASFGIKKIKTKRRIRDIKWIKARKN